MRTLWVAVGCLWAAVSGGAQSMPQKLPTGARIEAQQGSAWRRGVVSDDPGPGTATIRIRLDPDNQFAVVPRNSIRVVPAPASVHVGDRVEWYSTSTYEWLPATVKGVGTGSFAGYYLMVADKYPKSNGTYSKPENFRVLPQATTAAPAANAAPALGKYRCMAYGAPGQPPIFLGGIELKASGAYSATAGPAGRYSFDGASGSIAWSGGWMQDNRFAGKMDGNATIRIARTSICSHE